MTPKFKNGAPLFKNDKPSFCCCPDDCEWSILFETRPADVYGQVDGGDVVSKWFPEEPDAINTLDFSTDGAGTSVLYGQFVGSHTIRIWAITEPGDVQTINRVTLSGLSGSICINGVTYTVADGLTAIAIPVDEILGGTAADQSSYVGGLTLIITCGACAE